MSEKLREAAQQALEALASYSVGGRPDALEVNDLIARLEAALSEPEPVQEPVAWVTHGNDLLPLFHKTKAGALAWGAEPLPLYTAPPQRPLLTDEEIDALKGEVWGSSGIAPRSASAFARAVERKVRGEKE